MLILTRGMNSTCSPGNWDKSRKDDSERKEDSTSEVEFNIQDIIKAAPVKSTLKRVEVTTAKQSLTKIKQEKELLIERIRAAAIELGGDVSTTERELMTAYESTKRKSNKEKESNVMFKNDRMKFIRMEDERVKFETMKHERDVMSTNKFTPVSNLSGKTDMRGSSSIFSLESINVPEKLNIFSENVKCSGKKPLLKLWHELQAESLINSKIHAPKNYFEQLILWTQHGKLWHFPIDNEQGMELEKETNFTEHVFLDKHLEPWCPKSGPLRHFMELVTVGLSKNPYLTVQEKKEHIMWYKQYFEDKKKLLNELGVLNSEKTSETKSK